MLENAVSVVNEADTGTSLSKEVIVSEVEVQLVLSLLNNLDLLLLLGKLGGLLAILLSFDLLFLSLFISESILEVIGVDTAIIFHEVLREVTSLGIVLLTEFNLAHLVARDALSRLERFKSFLLIIVIIELSASKDLLVLRCSAEHGMDQVAILNRVDIGHSEESTDGAAFLLQADIDLRVELNFSEGGRAIRDELIVLIEFQGCLLRNKFFHVLLRNLFGIRQSLAGRFLGRAERLHKALLFVVVREEVISVSFLELNGTDVVDQSNDGEGRRKFHFIII